MQTGEIISKAAGKSGHEKDVRNVFGATYLRAFNWRLYSVLME